MAILCPPAQSSSDSSTLQAHVSWTHSKREEQNKNTQLEREATPVTLERWEINHFWGMKMRANRINAIIFFCCCDLLWRSKPKYGLCDFHTVKNIAMSQRNTRTEREPG